MREFGVHSEVGKLRTVMVCRPSLAHQRLTPGNCHELLFDDVIWVHEAQKDHYDFVLKMQERGIEVLELHDLLAESLNSAEARKFVLDRTITENAVGTAGAAEMRPWLEEMPAEQLATYLIGGIAISDLPGTTLKAMMKGAFGESRVRNGASSEHLVPARPILLDLWRRDLQPDVLARPQAGDAAAASGLQVPPIVQGRQLQNLVGRFG